MFETIKKILLLLAPAKSAKSAPEPVQEEEQVLWVLEHPNVFEEGQSVGHRFICAVAGNGRVSELKIIQLLRRPTLSRELVQEGGRTGFLRAWAAPDQILPSMYLEGRVDLPKTSSLTHLVGSCDAS